MTDQETREKKLVLRKKIITKRHFPKASLNVIIIMEVKLKQLYEQMS